MHKNSSYISFFLCFFFVFSGCGGGGAGDALSGNSDGGSMVNYEISIDCSSPVFSDSTVDTANNTEILSVDFSIDFNNPNLPFFVGKAYIISDPNVSESDFDHLDYTGSGFQIAGVSRNVEFLDFNIEFAYNWALNELSCKSSQGDYENEETIALTNEFGNHIYLLILGITEKYNEDLSIQYHYGWRVVELPLLNY